ncbi:hypothetical protein [Streptomyces sp. NPDC090021]|uniref:hypothetical protein n=1 Tax=Streptomyces sp. NPDC090021 TaxID=3365919 RepID=UPI0038142710
MLETTKIALDRRVIAREELIEALAASAAEATTGTEAEEKAVLSLAPVPGSTVPPWREGLPATVLAPDYQRILGVLGQQRSTGHGPLRARRREFINQATVRSATHRLGSTTNPAVSSARLTISKVRASLSRHQPTREPVWPPSVRTGVSVTMCRLRPGAFFPPS